MSTALQLMAWRELLTRIFDGFAHQEDVSPSWLVNPATRRRLKLDILYPEIGIAIRFVGLRGRGRRMLSDWELQEEEERDRVRAELCRQHGVLLVSIPLLNERPGEPLRALSSALGRAARRVAQDDRDIVEKRRLMPLLAQARRRCEDLIQRVRRPEDLTLYTDLWRDREARLLASLQSASDHPTRPRGRRPRYKEGMAVTHTVFGPGTVIAVTPDGDEQRVTVRFVTAGERTFLASLVADKLMPA